MLLDIYGIQEAPQAQGFSPGAILGPGETEPCSHEAYNPVMTELGLEPRTSDAGLVHFLLKNITFLVFDQSPYLCKNNHSNYTKIFQTSYKIFLITKPIISNTKHRAWKE